MHQSLAAVLLSGYRRSVLGLLFLRPDESFHGREVARRTGLPAACLLARRGTLRMRRSWQSAARRASSAAGTERSGRRDPPGAVISGAELAPPSSTSAAQSAPYYSA